MRRHPDVAWVSSDPGRIVVLRVDRIEDLAQVLQGSAAEIWRCLDSCHTRRSVISALASTYGVEVPVVRDDAAAFLDRLVELGLVVEG